jgi:hypothetical protein
MRRSVLLVAVFLAFPAAASGAVFTSQPYDDATFASGAGPFTWRFVSSELPGTEFGDVGYRVDGGEWHGCLQGSQEVSLSNLSPGYYSIVIADTYSAGWLESHGRGFEVEDLCASLDGQGVLTDSFQVTIPAAVSTPTPYVSEPSPWLWETAGKASEEQVAKAAAERKAKEEQERQALAALQRTTPTSAKATRCIVPALIHHSLADARRMLSDAHCKLGRITSPHKQRGALVVASQSPSRGKHLAAGAPVAVRLKTS